MAEAAAYDLHHRQNELDPPDIDRKVSFIAAYAVQCVVCLIIVALRFWSRFMLMRGIRALGWDDWIMAITWVRSHSFFGTVLVWY